MDNQNWDHEYKASDTPNGDCPRRARLITGGTLSASAAFHFGILGILIGPLAAALALLAIFGETLGHRGARTRRAACCAAAALLLTSAAAGIWRYSLVSQGLPPEGTSVATKMAGVALYSVFSIENRKSVGRIRDETNHAIQLIEEPNRGTNASLGVPGGSFVGVLLGCRMEADRPSHQPFNLLRS